jgi:hypothetical protein
MSLRKFLKNLWQSAIKETDYFVIFPRKDVSKSATLSEAEMQDPISKSKAI